MARTETDPSVASDWLRTVEAGSSPPDGTDLGSLLRAYRAAHGMTQEQLAKLLLITQPTLSKIESGRQHVRDVDQLRWIAEILDLPPGRLGVLADQDDNDSPPNVLECALGPVGDSQRGWWRTRRQLNQRRHVLGPIAAQLHPAGHRDPSSGVLAHPAWLPAHPVDLGEVALTWRDDAPPPRFTGAEPVSIGVRPLANDGRAYDRYSRAVRDLAKPTLFDNRICYRPLDVSWSGRTGRLEFGYTSYFQALDVCEALGHEFAGAWLAAGQQPPTAERLPLRAALGDPFDLSLRPAALSINTLTVRRDPTGAASVLLHKRSSAAVAAAGGMYHVIPAGVFQPSSIAPWHQANDFDLWRNVMREMSEELLGNPEHDGNTDVPIDYTGTEPFRSLNQARVEGRIRAVCLGVVIEPLTWWVEAQTVVVLDAEVFDDVFGDMVTRNDEGYLVAGDPTQVTRGIPFTGESLRRLASEPLAPVAANLLQLAWRHRHAILGR